MYFTWLKIKEQIALGEGKKRKHNQLLEWVTPFLLFPTLFSSSRINTYKKALVFNFLDCISYLIPHFPSHPPVVKRSRARCTSTWMLMVLMLGGLFLVCLEIPCQKPQKTSGLSAPARKELAQVESLFITKDPSSTVLSQTS
mmetsp:Transcript_8511/g.12347  ORF Transcript_8511/g.12347 Transcript_8511/m.12347 type:complete len:142 (+) Transcript_8511:301-726(+)